MSEPVVHIVDDDPNVRQALARLLRSHDLNVETYESGLAFLRRLPLRGPGCLLLDLSMPEMSGLELQEAIVGSRHDLAVIFISGQGTIPATVKAIKGGAIDFLSKPFEESALIEAITLGLRRSRELVTAGAAVDEDWAAFQSLTPREQEVCLLVAQGLLNKQIGAQLGITEKTTKFHRGSLTRKLRVNSVADLVKLIQRLRDAGCLDPPANAAGVGH
jgi:FixJ family two-component response regulator